MLAPSGVALISKTRQPLYESMVHVNREGVAHQAQVPKRQVTASVPSHWLQRPEIAVLNQLLIWEVYLRKRYGCVRHCQKIA